MSVAVIGGTGLDRLPGLVVERRESVETPYGAPAGDLLHGHLDDVAVCFLPRHGEAHRLPPHRINYRANLWALHAAGARAVIAVAAVGAIRRDLTPGALAVPHDLIDYTWGRAHTFSDGDSDTLQHVEFTQPYAEAVRQALLAPAPQSGIAVAERAVYGCTQGPRLESAAEVARLARDGCDVVGMTTMPEAGLARELGLDYACLAVVVNWAAGVGTQAIHGQMAASLETGMAAARRLLPPAIRRLRH